MMKRKSDPFGPLCGKIVDALVEKIFGSVRNRRVGGSRHWPPLRVSLTKVPTRGASYPLWRQKSRCCTAMA